jgi:hypothetical protein
LDIAELLTDMGLYAAAQHAVSQVERQELDAVAAWGADASVRIFAHARAGTDMLPRHTAARVPRAFLALIFVVSLQRIGR